jgi:protein ImuA
MLMPGRHTGPANKGLDSRKIRSLNVPVLFTREVARMSAPDRQQRLAALRDTIADIERRPILAEAAVSPGTGLDGFALPAAGLVQEIFGDERRNTGALLGFALGQARHLQTPVRRAVVYLQLLAEAQEMGMPYGPGLAVFGFDPQALVLIRPANMVELLWAAEEALACGAVAAVIADIAGQPKLLDFTASRRLNLRASAGGATMFLLRYGAWREASAAQLRWRLVPVLSAETAFDARAPGETRWRASLEKGAVTGRQNQQWLLEWTKNGFQVIDDRPDAARPVERPALSGALFADLADRLSKTG